MLPGAAISGWRIRVGEVTIPVRTITPHHAAYFAMCDGLEDMVLFAEDISDLKILGTSSTLAIFPLGEKSLQDIYDQVDNKAGYALLVITDKQLKASDYKFIDQIPVGILPESALNTIKDALGKYKEADYFDVKFETRSDLLFPAKPIVGKQWLGVDEVVGTTYIYDIGNIAENKLMWWGQDQGMGTGFTEIWDGEDKGSDMLMIPVTPPLKGTHRIYDLMITVGKTDYPMACDNNSDLQDEFLAMGQNIPFVYLDVVGNETDFKDVDVAGKIVGLNRGARIF